MSTLDRKGIKYLKMLNKIRNLNCGGCLYACLAVYTKLKQDGEELDKIRVVQLSDIYDKSNIQNNKLYLKGEVDTPQSASHFGLSFNGGRTVYDSNGRIDVYNRYDHKLSIPVEKIEDFCEKALIHGRWNTMFDREYGVVRMNTILGINLPIY